MTAAAPTQADIQALSAMLNSGRHEKAIMPARLLVERFPQSPLLHFMLGLALKSNPELAIASYRSALALKPDFFDALNNLGASLYMLGRRAEAVDSFQAAYKMQPGNTDLQNSLRRIYAELAQSFVREHRLDEAVDIYRRLLTLEPNNPKILSNFGGMLLKVGQFEEASKVLTRAMEGGPEEHIVIRFPRCDRTGPPQTLHSFSRAHSGDGTEGLEGNRHSNMGGTGDWPSRRGFCIQEPSLECHELR